MMELVAGSHVYYQATVMRESTTEIRVLFPGAARLWCLGALPPGAAQSGNAQSWCCTQSPVPVAGASKWALPGALVQPHLHSADLALTLHWLECVSQRCRSCLSQPLTRFARLSLTQRPRRWRRGWSGWTRAAAASGAAASRPVTGATSRAQVGAALAQHAITQVLGSSCFWLPQGLLQAFVPLHIPLYGSYSLQLHADWLSRSPMVCLCPADGGWEPKPVGEGGASMRRRGSGRSRGSAGGATRSRGTKHSTGALTAAVFVGLCSVGELACSVWGTAGAGCLWPFQSCSPHLSY